MRWRLYKSIAIFAFFLGGCVTQPPAWRAETKLLLDRAQLNEAAQVLPDEYARVVNMFDEADTLFRRGFSLRAEEAYKAAWLAGQQLEERLHSEQLKRSQDSLSRTEAELLHVARQRAILEEQRRLNWEEQQQQAEFAAAQAAKVEHEQEPKPRPHKESPVLTSYTVKRGESLPQIASRAEVYGDNQLWPLLYRSNRDQISDPRRIWPGQVLRIPRNLSADDIAEARRFALKNAYF